MIIRRLNKNYYYIIIAKLHNRYRVVLLLQSKNTKTK